MGEGGKEGADVNLYGGKKYPDDQKKNGGKKPGWAGGGVLHQNWGGKRKGAKGGRGSLTG